MINNFVNFLKNLFNVDTLKIKPMFTLFDNTKEAINLKCFVTSKAIVYFF